MTGALPWVFVALAVLAQAFFAAAELAIDEASGPKLDEAARGGDRGARRAVWFRTHTDRLRATTIFGTCLSAVLGAVVAAVTLVEYRGSSGKWWALALMLPLVTVVGQVLPKSIAEARATSLAPRLATPLYLAYLLLVLPVSAVLAYARTLTKAAGLPHTLEPSGRISRDELELLVHRDEPDGEIDAGERRMISRIFQFTQLRARDVMVPLQDVCSVAADTTVKEAAAIVAEHGYSRLPVHQERSDEVVGLLHHLDLLAAGDGDQLVGTIARQPHIVPEGQEIDELLVILQRSAATAAVVIDEYGGVVGLITLEDILEEIVGDIDDEFDQSEVTDLWRRTPEGWIVSGRAPIEKVNPALAIELPESDEYETVAGFLLDRIKRIPQRGETVQVNEGLRLTVHRASERAVEEVLFTIKSRA